MANRKEEAVELEIETIAKDIMSTSLILGSPDLTVEEALKLLTNYKITGLPIVSKKGELLGVVSEFDLLDQLALKGSLNEKEFKNKIHFSSKVLSVSEDTTLTKVVEAFISNKVRRMPVLDKKGTLVGLITRRDLMRVFYYRAQMSQMSS